MKESVWIMLQERSSNDIIRSESWIMTAGTPEACTSLNDQRLQLSLDRFIQDVKLAEVSSDRESSRREYVIKIDRHK